TSPARSSPAATSAATSSTPTRCSARWRTTADPRRPWPCCRAAPPSAPAPTSARWVASRRRTSAACRAPRGGRASAPCRPSPPPLAPPPPQAPPPQPPPPFLQGVQFGRGGSHAVPLTTLTLTFEGAAAPLPGAFRLVGPGGRSIPLRVTVASSNSQTLVTLT